jgi:hypothetical protein
VVAQPIHPAAAPPAVSAPPSRAQLVQSAVAPPVSAPPSHAQSVHPAVAPPPAQRQPVADAIAPPPPPWTERTVHEALPAHAPLPPAGRDRKVAVIGVALAVLVASAASGILLTRPHSASAPAAAVHSPAPAAAAKATPKPAQPTASASTTAFADPAGYFTASFTASPVRDARNLPVGNQSVPYVQWTNLVDVNVVEVVAYANYPGSISVDTPNAVLSASLAGSVAASQGTLVSNVFGTFDGFHDAEGIIAAPHGAGYAAVRAILAGHTMFEIIASGLKNPPALFTDLVSSFRIVKHSP